MTRTFNRLALVLAFTLTGLVASGCCTVDQVFRFGAWCYDSCYVPNASPSSALPDRPLPKLVPQAAKAPSSTSSMAF